MEKLISLTADTIDNADIDALCDWLKTYPKLTKGQLTRDLECEFSEAVECHDAIFVNSGSSANLLMLSYLKEIGKLKVGDRVGLSCLCWSTDLAPIIQLGLVPVLLDCNAYNLGISLDYLPSIIEEYSIRCIVNVSVLGIPGEMDRLLEICEKNNVVLLEDNCESLGSKYMGNSLGTFGVLSSWSTYFSHHISTIEGGFVTCHNYETAQLLAEIRSHGWKRDSKRYKYPGYTEKHEENMRRLFKVKDDNSFDTQYTFHSLGFNIRNTEIGAFLGLRQLQKLPEIVRVRTDNFLYFCRKMLEFTEDDMFNDMYNSCLSNISLISNFGLPIIKADRGKYLDRLKADRIEYRPLIAGNIGNHPVSKKYGVITTDTRVANVVHDCGFYLPNHIDITHEDVDRMVDVMKGL